ncbi:hypothetical protein Hte_006556 [Hypoxylon texense]
MKPTIASLLVAFLPALTATVSASPTPNNSTDNSTDSSVIDWAERAMSLSCTDIILWDSRFLRASCQEPPSWPAPSVYAAELDLDRCLANRWGRLQYAHPAGGYVATCSWCHLEGPYNTSMSCMCWDGEEVKPGDLPLHVGAAFNLDDVTHIRNSDGALTCTPPPGTNATKIASIHRGGRQPFS